MYVGSGNLCLRVENLERSIRFYEALGLKMVSSEGAPGLSALMRRGNLSIFLMKNFGSDSLNVRGADAFDVYEHLCSEGLEPTSKPGHQEDGGTNWMTQDPDGTASSSILTREKPHPPTGRPS